MNEERCDSCRFWEPNQFNGVANGPGSSNEDHEDIGDCHRHAPQPVYDSDGPPSAVENRDQWSERFAKLRTLRQGWNGYGAEAPAEAAIRAAERFVAAMSRAIFPPTRVAPSAIGGVGVTRKAGNRRVYVEFYNSGTIHALLAEGDLAETTPVENTDSGFDAFIKRAGVYLDG